MKENLVAAVTGYLSSAAGMVLGLINVRNMIEALLLGAMGALGGLIIKALWSYCRKKFDKWLAK